MRSGVMQITFNCQNSIVLTRDFLHLSHVQGSEFREGTSEMGLDKGYFDRIYGTFLLWLCWIKNEIVTTIYL